MKTGIGLGLGLVLGLNVFAMPTKTTQCNQSGRTKKIEVLYLSESQKAPCQVNYISSESPGETQVLWSADKTAEYCDKMAKQFIDKLAVDGWDCKLAEK